MSLVLDASVVVEFLTEPAPAIDLEDVISAGGSLHVPAICDVEVVSVVSRQVRGGIRSEDDGRDMLVDYVALPLTRHLHVQMIGRSFDLRDNVSARDATYLALAEVLGADLVTLDRSFARAVRRHTNVRVLP